MPPFNEASMDIEGSSFPRFGDLGATRVVVLRVQKLMERVKWGF